MRGLSSRTRKLARIETAPDHGKDCDLRPTDFLVNKHMSISFGWWAKDTETGKFQINVNIHGGNIVWTRKQGHYTSWEEYGPPTEEDWDKLIYEAERRVPRRLISPKQFADIKRLRGQ